MALLQDYQKLGSSRFGRPQLTQKVGGTYVPMTQPLYWAAAGMQVTLQSVVLQGTAQPQDSGLEYRLLGSSRFGRPALTRGVSPYLPTPLYFNNTPGPLVTALANAVLAGHGQETSLGHLATTLASAVLAGTGTVKDASALATTLASVVLAGTGTTKAVGHLTTTLANAVLAAHSPSDAGSLATTLANAVLAAKSPALAPASMTPYVWSGLVDLVYNGYSWNDATQIAASYSIGGQDIKDRNIQVMNAQKAMVTAVANMPWDQRPSWYNYNGSFGLTQENWNQGLPRGGTN